MLAKAYANHSASEPLVPYSFERKKPGASDVAIDIHFCGICHSDIHTARSEWGAANYPCVPGHEIVGVVAEVGSSVTKFKAGDRVGVGCMVDSCRECLPCGEGLENYCDKGFTGTYNSALKDGDYTKGGYSSHIVVAERFVLNLPDNLEMAAAAPLLCAGITTYSPLKHIGLKKGDRLGVLGLGGLGHMAVKLGASFGAAVTVLSRSPHKKADAESLGAEQFLLTTEERTHKDFAEYFDYIIDTVSAPHDLAAALQLLKRDGTLIMVGASDKPLDLPVFPLILKRRSIVGSLIGGIAETQEMLDHCSKHGITSDIEMIDPEQINEAYARTLESDVKYRFVMDCQKL